MQWSIYIQDMGWWPAWCRNIICSAFFSLFCYYSTRTCCVSSGFWLGIGQTIINEPILISRTPFSCSWSSPWYGLHYVSYTSKNSGWTIVNDWCTCHTMIYKLIIILFSVWELLYVILHQVTIPIILWIFSVAVFFIFRKITQGAEIYHRQKDILYAVWLGWFWWFDVTST